MRQKRRPLRQAGEPRLLVLPLHRQKSVTGRREAGPAALDPMTLGVVGLTLA